MKLDLVLENTRIKYTLSLLEEGESLAKDEINASKALIQESITTLRKLIIENDVIGSAHTLLQEELSPFAKRALMLGAGAGALAMGNAGEFGTGVKHMISAGKDAGQTALAGGANMINRTADYYKGPEAVQELGLHPNAYAAQDAARALAGAEHPNLNPEHVSTPAVPSTQDYAKMGQELGLQGDDHEDDSMPMWAKAGLGALGAAGLGAAGLGAKQFRTGYKAPATARPTARTPFAQKMGMAYGNVHRQAK